ncbi:MAG: ester cyclase [Proteobacteria bacterium]|nr:ester cyclase [Pseudomonadota bacterium]
MSHDDIKAVVRRFNIEVIQNGDAEAFRALMAPDFVNRTAPAGRPNGPESMWGFLETILRPAISNLTVTIHDQIAEGDKVTTRKTISGRHTGELLGVPATGRDIAIDVIDIVRVEGGRYREHWGINTLMALVATLKA